MDYPANPTDDELNLAWDHAGQLIANYEWLTARSVLAHMLTGTYRNPPGRPGPEFRDGDVVSDETALKALKLYGDMHHAVREMRKLVDFPRKLLARVVDAPTQYWLREINSGVIAMQSCAPRAEPLSHASALLRSKAHTFARYVLLVTNASADGAGEQRKFFGEVLTLTGWAFDDAEIDAAWAMAAKGTYGATAKSAGLRLTRQERAELKEWYAARGTA